MSQRTGASGGTSGRPASGFDEVIDAIDRVIDGDEARVYRLQASLVLLVPVAPNPLALHGLDGRLVGFANGYRNGRKVDVTLFFDYATQERLLAEADEPMYIEPQIVGGVLTGVFCGQDPSKGARVLKVD